MDAEKRRSIPLVAVLVAVLSLNAMGEDEGPVEPPLPEPVPVEPVLPEDAFQRTLRIMKAWKEDNPKLYKLLFEGVHEGRLDAFALDTEQFEAFKRWRLEHPGLFKLMFYEAWPDEKPLNGRNVR